MKPKLYGATTGPKIVFKAMHLEDAPLIHTYASDEDVSRYIGWNLMHTLDETYDDALIFGNIIDK